MTKKVLAVVLAVMLCLVLGACDHNDYKQAEELFAAGKYTAAMEIYSALGEYKDSATQKEIVYYEALAFRMELHYLLSQKQILIR